MKKKPLWARRRAADQAEAAAVLDAVVDMFRGEVIKALRDMERYGVGGADFNGSGSHYGVKTTYGGTPVLTWLVRKGYAIEKPVSGDGTYYTLSAKGRVLLGSL